MKTLQKSFAAGEITTELAGHVQSNEYQTGLSRCYNFITLPHGPAMFRPGMQFEQFGFGGTGIGAKAPRLIPFIPEDDTPYLLCATPGGVFIHGEDGTAAEATEIEANWAHTFGGDMVGRLGVHQSATQPVEFIFVVSGQIGLNGHWFYVEFAGQDGETKYYDLIKPSYGRVDNFFNSNLANNSYAVKFKNAVKLGFSPANDLALLHYAQSFDVLTLTTPDRSPVLITNTAGVWAWETDPVGTHTSFGSTTVTPAPASGSTTPTGTAGTTPVPHKFILTEFRTVNGERIEKGKLTGSITIDSSNGQMNITYGAAPASNAPTDFRVYFEVDGEWRVVLDTPINYGTTVGYIFGTSWPHVAAARGEQPPTGAYTNVSFWPRAVGYHEQRKFFGGDPSLPQTLVGTKTGTERDLSFTAPQASNDALQFNLATLKRNTIEHIVPLSSMIVLTQSAVFSVTGGQGGGIAFDNVDVKVRSYVGANSAQPAVTKDTILYAASRGGHIHAVRFSNEQGGHIVEDVSALAPHLFEGRTVRDMAIQESPYRILWVVLDNFQLLSFTYHPELKALAWHQHGSGNGQVHHVAVLPTTGAEDAVYLSVRRSRPDGLTHYFTIEKLAPLLEEERAYAVRLDQALIYDGVPVTTVTNLWPLEGMEVQVVADGGLQGTQQVFQGTVTLPEEMGRVMVGLPYQGHLQTLPIALEARGIGAHGQGYKKNVNSVILRVQNTGSIWVGPNSTDLRELQPEFPLDDPSGPALLQTGLREILVDPEWSDDTTVWVVAAEPFPAKVLTMALDLEVSS